MKAVIYKIYCKDSSIKDCYVGYKQYYTKTINLETINCKIINDYNNKNTKVYNFICKNGGLENWFVEFIEDNEFNSIKDILNKKKYYIETLNATLNMIYNKTNERICKEKSVERKNLWLQEHRK